VQHVTVIRAFGDSMRFESVQKGQRNAPRSLEVIPQ
jgi:hypothetical protein